MKLFYATILSLLSFAVLAQQGWTLLAELPEDATAIRADDLENIYFFNKEHLLVKTDTLGRLLGTYSNKRFSPTTQIITGNPFKLYMLLPDYNELLILDKRLQEEAKVDLNNSGFINVTTVAPSADNRSIWIFDMMKGEVVKMDDKMAFVTTTGPLHQFYELPVWPGRMLEKGGKLYLFYDQVGVAIFDDQGAFENFIAIPKATSLTVFGDKFLYVKDGGLEVYDPAAFITAKITTPVVIKGAATGLHYFLLQNEAGRWGVYRF